MRIKYVGFQNFKLVLALGMFLCWVFSASAAEKWDAKATARVNLRRNPSSNGVILSIVPKGYRVRILEKQGLWCKIDVEGHIHGKGWVYAEYLEEILSKVPEAETNLQAAPVEMPLGERLEGIHPAELPPSVRTPDEKQTLLHTPLPEKALWADVRESPSMHEESPSGRDKSGTLSRVKILTAGESPHTAPAQASPEVRIEDEKEEPLGATKNGLQNMQPKSNAVSRMENPVIGDAIHVAPVQPQQSGIKSHPPEMIKKAFSEIPIQGGSNSRHTGFTVEKKEPATTGQRQPLEVKERAMPNTSAVEATAKQRMEVSNKRKGPTANQKSMGLVELALKLTSIALTGLVILFIHRANKIAASHYKALTQFQNRLNSQP